MLALSPSPGPKTGLSPDRILAWSARAGHREAESLGFAHGIARDLALHTLARLARIARTWTRGSPRFKGQDC